MARHTSTHRVGRKKVKVDRAFQQAHIDAGYDRQLFGEHATPDHELLGEHAGRVLVEYLAEDLPGGAGGPVFRLTFRNLDSEDGEGGPSVTVMCADSVKQYLGHLGIDPGASKVA